MTSVVPMKLVPAVNIANVQNQSQSINTDRPNNVTLPILTSSQVNINKAPLFENISNLDSELLEILHNNDLNDDAKAKLYWIALHKAEIYKDKSMWTEPVIVELRENRFIPVPVRKDVEPVRSTIASIPTPIAIDAQTLKRKRAMDAAEQQNI